jgi:hypothetical protein
MIASFYENFPETCLPHKREQAETVNCIQMHGCGELLDALDFDIIKK